MTARAAISLMARVSSERFKKVIKVGVPKHRQNKYLMMYIREQESIYAFDELNCKPGDWVLLSKTEKPIDEGVEHRVERIVYEYGNYVDPLTGRRSFGVYHDDDMKKLEKIKVDL